MKYKTFVRMVKQRNNLPCLSPAVREENIQMKAEMIRNCRIFYCVIQKLEHKNIHINNFEILRKIR